MKSLLFSLAIICLVSTCTILKPEDPEMKVRAFISAFEQSLQDSDEAILKQFNVQQTTEAILSAVRVMQNAEEPAIKCETYFDQAMITFEETGVRVDIPTVIWLDTLGYTDRREVNVALLLSPRKDAFVITRLEGEDFYAQYAGIKGYLAEAMSEGQLLEHIQLYAETAKSLREKYDSAVWVAEHAGETYYYVVNGRWTDSREGVFLMGLVDQSGKEIIPVEYNMIGTLGFDWPEIVEVRISSSVGLFHLSQGEIVAPEYEWIAPYDDRNVFAIVKTDTTYGWLDNSYKFHAGFPSDKAKAFISNHEFLPTTAEYNHNTMTLCEIPSEENYGSGILIFPAYLSSTGIFQEIEGGFTMYSSVYRANTESMSIAHDVFDSVLDGINMLLTSITKQYLDGREGFYTSNEVSFIDREGAVVGTSSHVMSKDLTVTRIDSTLLQIKSPYSSDNYEIYQEDSDETETNIPQYLYFRLEETGPGELTSNRSFNFTEFVKLDSSYLTGEFTYIARETMNYETRNFLCDSTLIRMRNEILASYGYAFKDEETRTYFTFNNWYKPQYESLADIEGLLSDIDKHNLKFLEQIIGPLKEEEESI
jgi:hypothetical protein